jgi:hypothetical protein
VVCLPAIAATGPFATELDDRITTSAARRCRLDLKSAAQRRACATPTSSSITINDERLIPSYVAARASSSHRSPGACRIDTVPRYMAQGCRLRCRPVFALRVQARRFYLVRPASSLGNFRYSRPARRRQRRASHAGAEHAWWLLACCISVPARRGIRASWLGEALLASILSVR